MPPTSEKISSADPQNKPISPLFATEHLKGDLGGRTVRGGAITMSAQGVKFLLNLFATAILARLLLPADYGLIAMVAPITGFIALFKDMGLSMATVQREQVTHEQVSNLFWVNVLVSTTLMAMTAAAAPAIAWFYDEPRLAGITVAFAATFLIGGLSAQHQALLQRQMRFGPLAVAEIASMAVSIAVGIGCALAGLQYWSLVALSVSQAVVYAFLCWVHTGWMPGRPSLGSGVREMLRFGGYLTGFNVVNYLARNLDNVLIGKVWGEGPLGLYSRAYMLLLLPLTQILAPLSQVVIPTLSRVQDDRERYARFYSLALMAATILTMPIVMFLGLNSHAVILLFLGEKWLGAVPIFGALAVASFIQTFYTTIGWVLLSLGRPGRLLKWALFACPVMIASFFVGLSWGPFGVAVAYAGTHFLLAPLGFFYALRNTPVRLRYVLFSLLPGVALAIAFAAPSGILLWIKVDLGLILGLAARLAGGAVLAGPLLWIMIRMSPTLAEAMALVGDKLGIRMRRST